MGGRARTVVAVCVAVGMLITPVVMRGWAMDVHRLLTARAVDGLPDAIKPLFIAHRAFIAEHSVDPDLWRVMELTGGRGEEPPNHFLDMDFEEGATAPFLNIPREYADYVEKYGEGLATRYGRLPWRAEEVYNRLVAAFKDMSKPNAPYAADNARYLMAVLAHYVEDAHVPFHGALNYDGQLTNQRGIHARFEGNLVLRNRDAWKWAPVKVTTITDFRAYMFDALVASQQLVADVLAADRKATASGGLYDARYFAVFRQGAGPIAERRLNEAVSAVASAVHSAWVDAGRPALPAGGSRTPARLWQ